MARPEWLLVHLDPQLDVVVHGDPWRRIRYMDGVLGVSDITTMTLKEALLEKLPSAPEIPKRGRRS